MAMDRILPAIAILALSLLTLFTLSKYYWAETRMKVLEDARERNELLIGDLREKVRILQIR